MSKDGSSQGDTQDDAEDRGEEDRGEEDDAQARTQDRGEEDGAPEHRPSQPSAKDLGPAEHAHAGQALSVRALW